MTDERYILVIADNSEEMIIALEYACARSKKTRYGFRKVIWKFKRKSYFRHWC